MSERKDPKEITDMRAELVEARRKARGVKESARGLRRISAPRLTEITDADMAKYDKLHPPLPPSDDTTKQTH